MFLQLVEYFGDRGKGTIRYIGLLLGLAFFSSKLGLRRRLSLQDRLGCLKF